MRGELNDRVAIRAIAMADVRLMLPGTRILKRMKRMRLLSGLALLCLATSAIAGVDPDYGFGLKVSMNWRLQLSAAEVHTLRPDSDAARQGVRNGDRIIAIEDCEIPGCGARRAEKLLNADDGAARRFRLRRAEGDEFTISLRPLQQTADAPSMLTDAPEPP